MKLVLRLLQLRRQLAAQATVLDEVRREVEGVHVPTTALEWDALTGERRALARVAVLVRGDR